jgi:hypothetical protein
MTVPSHKAEKRPANATQIAGAACGSVDLCDTSFHFVGKPTIQKTVLSLSDKNVFLL